MNCAKNMREFATKLRQVPIQDETLTALQKEQATCLEGYATLAEFELETLKLKIKRLSLDAQINKDVDNLHHAYDNVIKLIEEWEKN